MSIKPRAMVVPAVLLLACFGTGVSAEEAVKKTVADLYADKAALAGKQVQVSGKVVKVNTGIMNRNFLHLQDGTGGEGSNDLTITTRQTAKVGDEVVVTGKVSTDVDFGAGYVYPLLMEEAAVTGSAPGAR